MKCPKCEQELTEYEKHISLNGKELIIDAICHKCYQRYEIHQEYKITKSRLFKVEGTRNSTDYGLELVKEVDKPEQINTII